MAVIKPCHDRRVASLLQLLHFVLQKKSAAESVAESGAKSGAAGKSGAGDQNDI